MTPGTLFDLIAPVDDGLVPPFLDPFTYLKIVMMGRCSGIPDCCIRDFLTGALPVDRELTADERARRGDSRCPACRAAGRILSMRSCLEPCACRGAVDAVAALLATRRPGCVP